MSTLSNELFAAAREDAPSDSLHDAMWDRLAGATGVAATAAGAQAASTTAKTFGAGKLLLLGGVIGAVSTALGVIVTLAVVSPTSSSSAPVRTPAVVARGPHGLAGAAVLSSPVLHKAAPPVDVRPVAHEPARETDEASDLAEEARLVTAARAALVAGDPSRALALVRATRTLSTRALEPEELGLEARALNALGRTDEAAATDLLLRRRYPDSALAR